ncbi:MAG: tetratricopeptide repeat protein [Candidatus Cloacimonetes bacterium]|nr:tetratricopeptide repeat protein [Candidatus Cloacimonadota bacterium]
MNQLREFEQKLEESESEQDRLTALIKIGQHITENLRSKVSQPYLEEAIKLALKLDNQSLYLKAQCLLSKTLYFIENYDDAINICWKAVETARILKDKRSEFDLLTRLGAIYGLLGDHTRSSEHFTNALHLSRRINNPKLIAQGLVNKGNILVLQSKLEKAREIFEKAEHYFNESGNELSNGFLNLNLGEVLRRQGHYHDALNRFEKALKVSKKLNHISMMITCHRNTGHTYRTLREFDKAEKHFLKGLHLAEKDSLKYSIRDMLGSLKRLYTEIGNYERAFEMLDRLTTISDVIYEDNTKMRIAESEQEFNLKMRCKEAEILKQQTKELATAKAETETALNLLRSTEEQILEIEHIHSSLNIAVTANHEINQPLMILVGNLNLIEILCKDSLTSQQSGYIKKIESSVEDISTILRKYRNLTPEASSIR